MSHHRFKAYLLSIFLIAEIVLPGCGTIITTGVMPFYMKFDHPSAQEKEEWENLSWIYSGTHFSYKCVWHPEYSATANVELFCLIDLPLSLAADTLILPVTIPLQIFNKKKKMAVTVTKESPHFVTVDPSGRYAYVANAFSGNISQYSISASGSLTAIIQTGRPGHLPPP